MDKTQLRSSSPGFHPSLFIADSHLFGANYFLFCCRGVELNNRGGREEGRGAAEVKASRSSALFSTLPSGQSGEVDVRAHCSSPLSAQTPESQPTSLPS